MPDLTFQERVDRVRQRMAQLGYPVAVTSGLRSAEEQARLFAQGRSTAGPIVTNAPHSLHQEGRAADLAFVVDGKPSYGENLPWDVLGKVAKEEGLEWGGDFKSLRDRPHVQMPGGKTMADDKMIVVEVPGLGEVEFPEGTKPEAMQRAIKEALSRQGGQAPSAGTAPGTGRPTPGLTEAQASFWQQHPTGAALARGATSTLPFAGAVGAELIPGAVETAPIMTGALGFGIGKGAEDLINEYTGLTPPTSPVSKALRMGAQTGLAAAGGGVMSELAGIPVPAIRMATRGTGATLETVGSHGFPFYIAGAHKMFSGDIGEGAYLIAAPYALKAVGQSLRSWGGLTAAEKATHEGFLAAVENEPLQVVQAKIDERLADPKLSRSSREFFKDLKASTKVDIAQEKVNTKTARDEAAAQEKASKLANQEAAAHEIESEREAAGLVPRRRFSESVSAPAGPGGRQTMTTSYVRPKQTPSTAGGGAVRFQAGAAPETLVPGGLTPAGTPRITLPEGGGGSAPPAAPLVAPKPRIRVQAGIQPTGGEPPVPPPQAQAWEQAPEDAVTRYRDIVKERGPKGDFEIQEVVPSADWVQTETFTPTEGNSPHEFSTEEAKSAFENIKDLPPTIVREGGRTYITDGHHTAAQAMREGKPIKAVVIDLDKNRLPEEVYRRQQAHISDYYAGQPSPFRQNLWDDPMSIEDILMRQKRGL